MSISLRSFLAWPAGASLLYLVSAAFLLGGAAIVLAPGSADEGRISERVALLFTVEIYVAAIAGLAALVCRWKPGNGDAVALLVLMALFVPGMNAGLATIATQHPLVSVLAGGVGLMLAGGYLIVIQRRVTGPWSWALMAPLLVIQAWHALAPGLLGLVYVNDTTPAALLSAWLPGWWLVIASGLALVAAAMFSGAQVTARSSGSDPCKVTVATDATVTSISFRWVLAVVAVAAGFLHQWLLTYSLNLGLNAWDLLGVVVIALLLVDVLLRRWGPDLSETLPFVEGALGIAATVIAYSGCYATNASLELSLICYPPLTLAIGSAALFGIAYRFRDQGTMHAASVWLFGALFTWGITSDQPHANFLAGAGAIFIVLCFVIAFASYRSWHAIALLVVLSGSCLYPEWGPALIASAAVISRGIRTRNLATGATCIAPLMTHGGGWIFGLITAAGGWLAVAAAFTLLGGGGWMSWRRAQPVCHSSQGGS